MAASLGVLTKEEISATTPRKFRVVKAYLRTVIRDRKIRRRLDAYVKCLSKLWSRGLSLLNLATHQIAGIPLFRKKQPDEKISWWHCPTAEEQTPGKRLYDMLFAGAPNACPTFLRQLVCPERWNSDKLDDQILMTLQMYRHDVRHLYTPQWKCFPRTALHQQETFRCKTNESKHCSHGSQIVCNWSEDVREDVAERTVEGPLQAAYTSMAGYGFS